VIIKGDISVKMAVTPVCKEYTTSIVIDVCRACYIASAMNS